MKKINKKIGFGIIILSFIFLFNPDIAIIDVLPDLFGYVLLVCGLDKLSSLNEAIADARNCFRKACALSGVNLLLVLVLFGMVSSKEMPVTILLFTFVMGVLNLIYIIPGYIKLFSGLLYLGERNDGEFLLSQKKYRARRKPKKYHTDKAVRERYDLNEQRKRERWSLKPCSTERIRNFTILFAIVKSVGAILPEFSSLLNYEYFDSLVNYYDFIGLYRIFAILIVLIIGFVWLVKISRFFFKLGQDRPFVCVLEERYEKEVLPNKVYFIKKHVKKLTLLFTVAGTLCIDIYFDRYNFLPGFVSALIFFFASYSVREYSEKWKGCAVSSAIYFVLSVIFEIQEILFNKDFSIEVIMRNPQAYRAHQNMLFASCLQNAALVAVVIFSLIVTADMIRKHTGFYVAGHDSYNPLEKARELHYELIRPLFVTGAFGVLSAACNVVFVYCMSTRFGGMWIINLCVTALYAILFAENLNSFSKQADYKYMIS